MRRSRRRFLRLLAAGSAAVAAAPVAAVTRAAASTTRRGKGAAGPETRTGAKSETAKPGARPAFPPAAAEEIRKQKANVEQALTAVRNYRLPPGSDPAFVFSPLKARKAEREP